jgi:WD40 repeat protein
VLTGHSEDVTCVVLTSRGRFAVTGSLDGTAQVWDMQAQDVSNTHVHDGKVRPAAAAWR